MRRTTCWIKRAIATFLASIVATGAAYLALIALFASPASATTLQATLLSPITGRITSNPAEPHWTPYNGDLSWDVASGKQVAHARFRNPNGSLSLRVAQVGPACASGAFADGGNRITLNVSINGQKVGTVVYSHLVNIRYSVGAAVPVGAAIGDVGTTADGLRAHPGNGCWTGSYVHVEPRNDRAYACFFPLALGTNVDGGTALAVIGGEHARAANQACPPGVEGSHSSDLS